jgi:hypothetical protein
MRNSSKNLLSLWGTLLVGAVFFAGTGLAHNIQIESTPPGATVIIDGQQIGEAPVTYSEPMGGPEVLQVEVKSGGQSKAFTIKRTEMNMMNIGIGAGVGAGACCLAWGGGGIASLFVPFVGCFSGPAGCLFLVAGPAVAYFVAGKQGPDVVTVNFENGEIASTPPGLVEGEGAVASSPSSDEKAPEGEPKKEPKPKPKDDAPGEGGGEAKKAPAKDEPLPAAEEAPAEEDVQPY